MKHLKSYVYENKVNNNMSKLRECKSLFDEIFSEKLGIYTSGVQGIGGYNIYAIINKKLNKYNIENFDFLFDFIKNTNLTHWEISPKNITLRLDIYFDNIDEIIRNLELLKNSKDYNIY